MTRSRRIPATRIRRVNESKTTRVFAQAQQMMRQGRKIINLAVGEPDFATPEPVIAATRAALEAGATRYGPVAGLPELRARIAAEFDGYGAANVLITNGAKQALYQLFQALCNPGDEVIVPKPCWVSFTEQIKLAGARPILVPTIGHQLDPDLLEQAVTRRSRAILINPPNNPTGAVYSAESLRSVAAIAERHGLLLIADEAYHQFCYDGHRHARLFDLAADRRRVITVRSFSKHYNMTGFRLGYVAADADIITALTKLQSHASGNVCTFAQHGALAALDMDQAIVQERAAALQHRRDIAYNYLASMANCVNAQGAFYLFPEVFHYIRRNETSEDVAMLLLEKTGVAVIPGEAFHGPGHIRISFAVSEMDLHKAFERIKAGL